MTITIGVGAGGTVVARSTTGSGVARCAWAVNKGKAIARHHETETSKAIGAVFLWLIHVFLLNVAGNLHHLKRY
jgi:hypothetical protein